MWKSIARKLVKLAIWCAGHPDEIASIVTAVKAAKK